MATVNHEERLYKIFANVNDWLKYGEAKNLGLLTLNAAFVFGIGQIEFNDDSIIRCALYYVFIPFSIASFFASLLSLFPLLTKIEKGTLVKTWINKLSNFIDEETNFENIHFYGYLKDIDLAEFETKYLTKTTGTNPFNDFEKELVTQILYNSRITWLKYQLFKIGAFIFGLGLFISILSLPIISFFGCNK